MARRGAFTLTDLRRAARVAKEEGVRIEMHPGGHLALSPEPADSNDERTAESPFDQWKADQDARQT